MAQNITLKNNSRAYKSLIDLKDKYTTPGRTGVDKNSTAYEKLGELRKKYYTDKVSADDVKNWFSSVAPAIEEMSKYNEQFKDTYTTDYGGELSTKIKDLMNQSGDVYAYLQNHKGDYDNFADLAKTFYDYRAALEDYDVNNYKQNRYYSKFDNEDQYNWYKSIDSNYINSYIEDVNKYSSAPMESKYDAWNDSDIASKTDSLRTWLRLSQNSLDADTYKSFNDTLESMSKVGKELSGFTDSAAYAEWYKRYEMENSDLGALQTEINSIKQDREGIRRTQDAISKLEQENQILKLAKAKGDKSASAKLRENEDKIALWKKSIQDAYAQYGDIDQLIAQKEQYYTLASSLQNVKNLTNDALNSVDFNEYSSLGAENPTNRLAKAKNAASPREANKIATQGRPEYYSFLGQGGKSDDPIYIASQQMTDEEFKIYNYYYEKDQQNGTRLAQTYLESIQDQLNEREGEQRSQRLNNTALELILSASAGMDQFKSGMIGAIEGIMGEEDYRPTSPTQYASQISGEDNKGLWKFTNDAITTISNMAPSIAAGTAIPGLGTGLLVSGAFGNARNDMLKEGYSKEQANSYAVLTAASEGVLSKVLGGISAFGGGKGIFQSIAGKIMPHLNKAVWRVAVDVGGNMLDEGLEEAIQEVLDPVFKAMATGEDFEGVDIENVLYSGLLGAVSGGLIEGVPTITNTAIQSKNAQNLYGADAQALVGEALEINPDNLHAQAMQKQLDAGKTLSGYQLNRLAQENDSAIAAKENSDLKSATIDRLYKLGEKSNTDALSDIIVKAKSGEKLSKSERSTLVHSKYGQLVLNEIKTGKLGAANAVESGENTIAKQDAAGGKFEASQAVSKGNIKTPVKEIASVKDGVITLRLDDGSVVNANEVSLDSKTSSLYEKVAEMNLNSASANLFVDNYDGKSSVSEYAHDFSQAYRYGELGVPKSEMFSGKLSSTLTEKQMDVAYELGKMDAKYKVFDENKTANDKNNLKYSSNSDIIKNNKSEVISNESTNGLYLRDGGKRIDGENTEGSVFDLESGTRAYTQRRKSGRVADSEASRLAYEGREVSVASLGILRGSANHTVRLVDAANETATMKQARKRAEARGLKVKFFAGDNLVIADKEGKLFSARGYILGDTVLVRADHDLYTSDQIIRHEIGHDMIAKGEVDIDEVRERLAKVVGKENADAMADLYAYAYAGTTLTAEEIWEECVCDSLGDMNIFTSDKAVFDAMTYGLEGVKKATLSTAKSPNQTRGSPEGKASREVFGKNKSRYIKISEQVRRGILWELRGVYGDVETAVADEIAVALGDTVYIVDSGREKSKITCQAIDKIVIKDKVLREEYIRRTNYDALSKGYISDGLSGRFRRKYAGDRSSNRRQQIRSDLQTDNGKSADNQSGVLGENADKRGIEKASRELDTEYLSAVERGDMETAQKMVDEAAKKAGYTIKGYHGSHNSFTVFDEGKSGLYGGVEARIGFWFGTTKKGAENWANETWGTAENRPQVYDSWLKIRKPKIFVTKEVDFESIKKADKEIESAKNEYNTLFEELRGWGLLASWTVSDYIRTNGKSVINNLHNIDENTFSEVKRIAEELVSCKKKIDQLKAKRGELVFTDSYEQFQTEIYKLAGMDAEDANVGGLGRHIANGHEVVKKYREKLISQGYDGIIIRDTRFDADTLGEGKKNEQIVVFDPNQIKSADPVTYDDNGNVIPLSERFNTKESDIRFSRELDVIDYMNEQAEREGRELAKPRSNREILANALESSAQHEVEKKRLAEYKAKIKDLDAEQEKLKNLKAEIKELTFGTQKKDPAKLKALREEAVKTENRIKYYDKKLLELEAMTAIKNVLEVEKRRSFKSAMSKAREIMHENVESRYKTAERNKIKRVAHELDALLNRGTKERNVKKGIAPIVRSALDISNMLFATDDELLLSGIGTEYTDTEQAAMDEYMTLYEEYHSYDDAVMENKEKRKELRSEMNEVKKKFEGVLERERRRIASLKAKGAFDVLIEEYGKLANSDEGYIRQVFDADTLEHIKKLKEDVGETLIKDMTLEQLQKVYKAYRMVQKMVTNANKTFATDSKATIEELGDKAQKEIELHGEKGKKTIAATKGLKQLGWDNLKPVYLMERIGSKTLQNLFQGVLDAESQWARYTLDAQQYIAEQEEKYHYKDWDLKKTKKFTTPTGLEYKLTLGQMMTVYAYSKRGEQATEHLRNDGFVFDKIEVVEKGIKYELTDKTAYKISDSVLLEIVNGLSKDQKAYVDAMQEYLSDTLGKRGNEVSNKLYGIDLFNEENYLPIRSERAYLERARDKDKGTYKIKNRGFTKPTQKNASNAIVLEDFNKLCAEHIVEMNEYAAFTLPLEDFYRVYNYQNLSNESTDKKGVIPAIINAYGDVATKSLDRLLDDLNGSARSEYLEGMGKHAVSAFKKAKVMLSLSVVIQQPSSILRAQALIDPKYFVGKKLDKAGHKAAWEELKKYAPVAIIKEMGYFDVGMGRSTVDWLLGDKTVMDHVDEWTSKGAAYADEVAWISIWNAVKRETLHNNPTMSPTSEKFLNIAGKRFEDIIRKTQVYDSTLSRSANMRSKSLYMQMITSFMAEPTTSLNMREMALRSGDKARIARVTAAVYASALLNAVLVALPYAMRDEDEDETFAEKYLSALTSSFVDNINPITSIPFFKDIWSLATGYSVERQDMSLFSDLLSSTKKLVSIAIKEDNSKEEIAESWVDFIGNFANLTGIPVKNLYREIKSIVNTAKTLDRSGETTWNSVIDVIQETMRGEMPVVGWLPGESKTDKLYDAIIKGDKAYEDRIKSTYDTDAKYQNAVRKALKENDPRIEVAAQALIDGDYEEYGNLIDDIVAEGHFTKNDVKAAIESKRNSMDESEKEEKETAEKEESIFETEYYYNAIVSGDTEYAKEMRDDIINAHMANGMDKKDAEKSLQSSFSSHLKKMYISGNVSRADAKKLLVKYGGCDDNEAYWDLRKWDYVKANGSDEGYSMYNEFNEAVRTGKNLKAVIKEYTSHGKDNKTLGDQITSYYKPIYKKMTTRERANLKPYLLNAYALLDYDRDKKMKDIDKWLED